MPEALSHTQIELLQAISQGIRLDVQQRYVELHARLLDETLSEEEHSELLGLVEVIEKADADRLKYLLELAQLRSTSLDALMAGQGRPTETTAGCRSQAQGGARSPGPTRGGCLAGGGSTDPDKSGQGLQRGRYAATAIA